MVDLGLIDDFLKRPQQRTCAASHRRSRRRVLKRHRLRPPAGRLQVRRLHAPVGVPELPRRGGAEASGVQGDDAGGSHGPDCRKWPCYQAFVGHTPDGPMEIRADLVVGADGRASILREKAGLQSRGLRGRRSTCSGSACRATRRTTPRLFGRLENGATKITIDRGDYWQCAYAARKAAPTP